MDGRGIKPLPAAQQSAPRGSSADKNSLTGNLNEFLPDNAFLTSEDRQRLREKLMPILQRCAHEFTLGDRTSLTLEEVEALLESLRAALSRQLAREGLPPEALLTANTDALYERSLHTLETDYEAAKRLYDVVYRSVPPIVNDYLEDTLRGVSAFLAGYQFRTLAHVMPDGIDYPLCVPQPDAAAGIDTLWRYLNALLCENELMSRYPVHGMLPFLRKALPDYEHMPFNLCEPLAAALLLSLLTNDSLPAVLSADLPTLPVPALEASLSLQSEQQTIQCFTQAAAKLVKTLALRAPGAADYWRAFAESLVPRFRAYNSGHRR